METRKCNKQCSLDSFQDVGFACFDVRFRMSFLSFISYSVECIFFCVWLLMIKVNCVFIANIRIYIIICYWNTMVPFWNKFSSVCVDLFIWCSIKKSPIIFLSVIQIPMIFNNFQWCRWGNQSIWIFCYHDEIGLVLTGIRCQRIIYYKMQIKIVRQMKFNWMSDNAKKLVAQQCIRLVQCGAG